MGRYQTRAALPSTTSLRALNGALPTRAAPSRSWMRRTQIRRWTGRREPKSVQIRGTGRERLGVYEVRAVIGKLEHTPECGPKPIYCKHVRALADDLRRRADEAFAAAVFRAPAFRAVAVFLAPAGSAVAPFSPVAARRGGVAAGPASATRAIFSGCSSTRTVRCAVRFTMRNARPIGAGRTRFSDGPWFA